MTARPLRRTRRATALIACLAVTSGCMLGALGPTPPFSPLVRGGTAAGRFAAVSPVTGSVFDAAASVSRVLAGATDETADLFPRLLRPEEGPPPGGPIEGASRFGVRLGLLLPTSAEEGSWGSAARAGVYYRSGRRIAFEVGVDHASVEGEHEPGQTVASKITFLRFDALFGLSGGDGSGAGLFLLGGAELGLESSTWEPTGDAAERKSGGLSLGVGLGPRSGAWDARVVYSIFVGSDNAAGSVMTAVGYAF